jgi:hypothetical protein
MGLLDKILGRKLEPLATLEQAIERLQAGILIDLTTEYGSRLKLTPPSDAVVLANCVLSYATAMKPMGERAQQYYKSHSEFVHEQAAELASSSAAESLSYLYAAITILLAVRTRNPLSELATELGTRASELSIYIPNPHDICGSGDAVACVYAISDYASKLVSKPEP